MDKILIEKGRDRSDRLDDKDWRESSERHSSSIKNKKSIMLSRKLKSRLKWVLSKFNYQIVHIQKKEKTNHEETVPYYKEKHHQSYGRPWCLGRDHIDYLIEKDLKAEHKFLDLGCGALRTGIWVIPYLNSGNYFGVEAHLESLESALKYEIPLNNLATKKPRFLNSSSFELDHWGIKFDRIFCWALFDHIEGELRKRALKECSQSLVPNGRLIMGPKFPFDKNQLEEEYSLKLIHEENRASKMLDDELNFYELERV